MEKIRIRLTVNGNSFSAVLEPGQTAEALRARLERGDIKIRMEDYGNMEKVGGLGFSLPRHDVRTVTGPGDMVLYQGNSLVIFYGTNTWSYTRLGKVEGVSSRERMLELWGTGDDATVTLSLE